MGEALFQNLENQLEQSQSSYQAEYEQTIAALSELCLQIGQLPKRPVDELAAINLLPQITALAHNHKSASVEDQQQCFLQTLLKGSFSLLAIKTPEVALKVSVCTLQVFLQYFLNMRGQTDDQTKRDF